MAQRSTGRTEPGEGEAGTRPYDAEVARLVERLAADLTEAGMQRMASRVFACLMMDDSGALTSAELAERLQVSPAAISQAVRYLSQVHMVSREREPGSRRERYRVQADVWHEAISSRNALLDRWRATFQHAVTTLGEDTPAGRRLSESTEFLTFMQGELSTLLDRWKRQRAQRAEDGR
ncbi:MarR family transcriptional regulator [Streptomyces sp. NPDC005438]|uniref:GbsR/MarR family transcriptional regulator n=1 Tax=Streptomyces sp. NPDC005438 TaxID=3156880 RepID=UPI0033B9DCD7